MSDGLKFIVLSKNLRGQIFTLKGKETFSVGRVEDKDLLLPDGTISTTHAHIIIDKDRVFVKDNASTNGTRVNGTKVTEKEIIGGDVVQFGGVELLYDDGKVRQEESIPMTSFDVTQTAGIIQLSDDLMNMNPRNIGNGKAKNKGNIIFYIIIAILLIAIFFLSYTIIR